MRLSPMFPADAGNRAVLAVFLLLWALSYVILPYPKLFRLQHVPTVAVVSGLAFAQNRLQISRLSYTLIIAFMALHVLGASYLYSYVPYDEWSQRWLGVHISANFGFTRNHYDRLVHFCYGLFLVLPAWRFSRRIVGLDGKWSAAFAIMAILSTGAIYEIFEWLVALVMAPDRAESYNGQQGDVWDPQWDMALAACGALLGLCFVAQGWLGNFRHDKVQSEIL